MASSANTRIHVPGIGSIDDLAERVEHYGFFPMFSNGISGFSVYECTPHFWTDDNDGPWEWKGPMIREGQCAYGKFFNRKAGYVSRRWLPDFLNYRRTLHLAPNDDAAALDDIVLQTIYAEGQVTIQDLRRMFGLGGRKRRADDPVADSPMDSRLNLDTNLTRLMMEGRVCIADFAYNIDRRGNPYGWGIARYTIPEALYGHDIQAACSPDESHTRMVSYLQEILPEVPLQKIAKIIIGG